MSTPWASAASRTPSRAGAGTRTTQPCAATCPTWTSRARSVPASPPAPAEPSPHCTAPAPAPQAPRPVWMLRVWPGGWGQAEPPKPRWCGILRMSQCSRGRKRKVEGSAGWMVLPDPLLGGWGLPHAPFQPLFAHRCAWPGGAAPRRVSWRCWCRCRASCGGARCAVPSGGSMRPWSSAGSWGWASPVMPCR